MKNAPSDHFLTNGYFPKQRMFVAKKPELPRHGKVRTAGLIVAGFVALIAIIPLVVTGVSKIPTARTFSDGAVQIDVPLGMWDSTKKPAGTVLLCENRFRGVVLAAYTLPDNNRRNLAQLAKNVGRGGGISFGGSNISMSGFPRHLRINGNDAYQLDASISHKGKRFTGAFTFLHVASRNYAVLTAAPAQRYQRYETELQNIVKTIRPAGTLLSDVETEETVASSTNESAVSNVPSKPYVAAQFESVDLAIDVLKRNELPASADQEANRCQTDKGWRASAVAYLADQPLSQAQQTQVVDCIDDIVQSEDTFLDRNEFYEALVRSKWELPDSLMLELATRLVQGNHQVPVYRIGDELVAWIKRERPESLAQPIIEAAIKHKQYGEDLIELYPQQAALRVFEEKMRGSTSAFWLKDLEKLVGEPDPAAAEKILLSVLNDSDDENDKTVMEYLTDKTPADASSELSSRVSWTLACDPLDCVDDPQSLATLVENWLWEEHHGAIIESLRSASSHDRSKLLPIVISLGTDDAYQGVIDSIQHRTFVSNYAASLPDSESDRERFELMLIKSCDIADPDRVATCCDLLARFGGAASVVAISNARDWAYHNDEFHLRVAADRALDKLASRVNIDDALHHRDQHLARLRSSRKWTSGKFEVEARLLKVDGDYVVLQKEDESTIRVEIARLSDTDQQYVKQQSRKNN